jgi:hypothetical protein
MNWSSAGEKAEGENKLGIGWSCVALLVWIGLGYLLAHLQPHADPHDHPADRRGLVHIAEQVRATDIRREPRVIYVAGEPALFFQLCAVGEPIVAPIPFVPREPATKDGRPISTFIVVGPHANRDLRFKQAWAATQDRWELVAEYDYRPSLVVWLDLNDPRESPQLTTRDRDRVRLYRLRE